MKRLSILAALLGLILSVNVNGYSVTREDTVKDILVEEFSQSGASDFFVAGSRWVPLPEYSDREGWDSCLGAYAQQYIKGGEKYLDYKWQSVPATAYLEYERSGERKIMETPLDQNRLALNALMLAELAEGKGRFLDRLLDGAWHFAHMPSWVLSAHHPRQKSKRSLPDSREQLIDLVSGGCGATMSYILYFFKDSFDAIDPSISFEISRAIKRNILDPYLNEDEDNANWWLGFTGANGGIVNNWNPWCNSDTILAFLLVEEDQKRLDAAVWKSVRSVDKFINYVKKDGACEEGPSYWQHAAGKLYDYLQIMHDASQGRYNMFSHWLVRAMGEYISRSYIADGYVVNFADATAKLSLDPSVVYNYGKAVGSDEMMDFAIYNLADKEKSRFKEPKAVIWKDSFRSLCSIRNLEEMRHRVEELNSAGNFNASLAELRKCVPPVVWYELTEFCYMKNRSGWFFGAKGGHNNESHNHNDVGSFLLYMDGVPMFIDAGVGTYTKKTFSSERYTIWSMQTNYHNLPLINGTAQHEGAEYHSRDAKAGKHSFCLDIAGAYTEDACCNSWKRTYTLTDKSLKISDIYTLSERRAADVLNFMVQGQVHLPGDVLEDGTKLRKGEIVVENMGKKALLRFPVSMIPSVEAISLDDPRLSNVWGPSIRRISLTSAADAPASGRYDFTITCY